MKEDRFNRAKKYCFRLLSLRSRSESEIRSGLEKKGYGSSEADGIIEYLKNKGLINDFDFSGEWIDSRLRTSPRSVKMLKEELVRKGVGAGIIREAIESRFGELDDRTLAAGILKDKVASGIKEKDVRKLKGKLFRLLLQRGFEADLAEEVVDEFTEKQEYYDF